MSECVVRMEIPKSCWVCPFGIDGYLWNENDARTYHVRLCSQHSGVEYRVLKTDDSDRPWYCDSFICQLPERHGRLIDWDAFERIGFKLCRKTSECRAELGTPTNESYVVPADEYPVYMSQFLGKAISAERSET